MDWCNVSSHQVHKYGGGSLIQQYNGSLLKALQTVFPHYDWNAWRAPAPQRSSKSQYLLFQHVVSIS